MLARPSGTVRTGVLLTLLAAPGIAIAELVREQTGTPGFFVGLGLALLPVGPLTAVFLHLGRPASRRGTGSLWWCFGWGACAAALIAILANGFATEWMADAGTEAQRADRLGSMAIAPVVEEIAKGAALLPALVLRRPRPWGITDSVVVAGFTATGFAFTENILYLGNAFGEDLVSRPAVLDSLTLATLFVRLLLSPFAHPLFTALTALGLALGARRRTALARRALPALGLAAAMGAHGLWNGSSEFGEHGFHLVYASVMVPLFALVTAVTVRSRSARLRAIRDELGVYAEAGWLGPAEREALASPPTRALARSLARRAGGRAAARALDRYAAAATELALARRAARRHGLGAGGAAGFTARERELLEEVWARGPEAGPALCRAALAEGLVVAVPLVPEVEAVPEAVPVGAAATVGAARVPVGIGAGGGGAAPLNGVPAQTRAEPGPPPGGDGPAADLRWSDPCPAGTRPGRWPARRSGPPGAGGRP
ncbi:PrsW family intramembrane metalloprotease [Streptomyces sp. BI20]|uniref:PrsW family intramembrane metalloprotease n=1 Tax=Streptomyces sp. BI20 TaxID=3403460 RepID=UPI003C740FD5